MAKAVHRQLARAGWQPWLADEDVAGGVEWADEIATGLRHTDAVVVLLTADSVVSPWVEREVAQAALAHIPMVPVSVDGTEPQGGLKLYLDTVQRVALRADEPEVWPIEQALIRRLTRGRSRSRSTAQLRIGQVLRLIGMVGVVVAFGLFFYFGYEAIANDTTSIAGLDVDEARQEFDRRREQSDRDFLRIASAFPVFLVSAIVAGIGEGLVRSAQRKRL